MDYVKENTMNWCKPLPSFNASKRFHLSFIHRFKGVNYPFVPKAKRGNICESPPPPIPQIPLPCTTDVCLCRDTMPYHPCRLTRQKNKLMYHLLNKLAGPLKWWSLKCSTHSARISSFLQVTSLISPGRCLTILGGALQEEGSGLSMKMFGGGPPPIVFHDRIRSHVELDQHHVLRIADGGRCNGNTGIALGLLANLKETRKVKWACRVEATSITSVAKGVMVVIPK